MIINALDVVVCSIAKHARQQYAPEYNTTCIKNLVTLHIKTFQRYIEWRLSNDDYKGN